MKFYVNEFYGDRLGGEQAGFPNIYPNMYIGLFTQCETKGEGSFCGYYGAEYYLDTELIAYYEAEGTIYRPEKRISDVKYCYFKRKKILIGSHMWTKVIEAETTEEAIEKFKNADWRQWRSPEDEVGRAEWWTCECGGVICSKCGWYYDDYYTPAPPRCGDCRSVMNENTEMYVHKEWRLSRLGHSRYIDEEECPEWLRNRRKEFAGG